ncbi:Transcriptional repressor OPI1 [Wickerhamomyces ciferrii]|uniref:Transcriptional repressor OPI1 n=1 Tax=Wickerhamomyces ciferrii (strain ATCC 14091 / BCRC 22168 / CBS 111 / JCM 3599 / NBRC 0793 / NRRL Y-1031 F-60-10) TaxID=1206466 RepID=K0KVM9_WICCF|nr:Transcriptional repressor OPI1 [Wickerhamomyces ciferrii]CCH46002.1 Transcriptional repressor OPI1 [Wickerhamomyces ciferrii]
MEINNTHGTGGGKGTGNNGNDNGNGLKRKLDTQFTEIRSNSPVDENNELLAIQALGQLKNSGTPNNELLDEDEEDDEFYDTNNDIDTMIRSTMNNTTTDTGFFMRNIKSHPLYNSALRAYRINKPTIKYGVEMMEKAAIPMVNIMEQTRLEWKRKKRLKRANSMFPDEAKFLPKNSSLRLNSNSSATTNLPSISEALSLSNINFNEFSLNLSIESKKRIATCLQLLMLANKQLSSKIQHLQDLISKERELFTKNQENNDELLPDDSSNDNAIQIKQEIVTTIKKVVSLISKYAGNSLPEPARSNVRQTLLRLPTKWASSTTTDPLNQPPSTSTTNSSSFFNTNGKVLILANESLEMVSSIMNVFDETLNKAELWVKQKQQKQLTKMAILNNLQQNQIQHGHNQHGEQNQIGSSKELEQNHSIQQNEKSNELNQNLKSIDKGKDNDDELLSD